MAQSNLTYNQVIQQFREYAETNKMLASFGYGEKWDFDSKQQSYPLMYVSPEPSTVEETVINLRFAITFADLPKADESNLTEIHSDQHLNALNFISWLQTEHEDLDIELTSDIEPFSALFTDNV